MRPLRSASNHSHSSLGLIISLLSLQFARLVHAQVQEDIRIETENGAVGFDLRPLKGEYSIGRTRDIPPSEMQDELRLNLFEELKQKEGIAANDQCSSGTLACWTTTNRKKGFDDRVVAVIPIATVSNSNPSYTILSSPKGLNILLTGGTYPSQDAKQQSLSLDVLCDTTFSNPTLTSYDEFQAKIQWRAPAGCSFSSDKPADDGKKDENNGDGTPGNEESKHVGSGVGWFFLVLLLALIAYFILGAYYNYSTYGAQGADLIPHRDFWREVPYILRDIASHLCSALRPSPRNGYIAV